MRSYVIIAWSWCARFEPPLVRDDVHTGGHLQNTASFLARRGQHPNDVLLDDRMLALVAAQTSRTLVRTGRGRQIVSQFELSPTWSRPLSAQAVGPSQWRSMTLCASSIVLRPS